MEAVQFLSAVLIGDYVAVRPFVPTEGNERLLQGYVREYAADEPFQAEGVLVVLTDNTIGYVTTVIDSQARGSSPAAPSAQKSSKARKASKSPSRDSISTAIVEGPARMSSTNSSSLNPLQQWMQDAEAAAAPVVLQPELRRRNKVTAQRDMQLWREFEALQQQHGEALCSTILLSCNHDFAEAIELIKAQASSMPANAAAAADSSSPGSPTLGAVGRLAAAPATVATAADEGLVRQLALSLGLLPNDALQLARIVPDLPADEVVAQLQQHNGDVGAAADALLSSQVASQDVPSPPASSSSGSSSPTAGCGIAAGLERHVAQAFIAGKDPARVAAARQLSEMAPGLSIELAVLLLEEHGGNLNEVGWYRVAAALVACRVVQAYCSCTRIHSTG
jgi:hypothetical protein